MVNIREATTADISSIWKIFSEVVASGDTYPFAPDTSEDDAIRLWVHEPLRTYVAVLDGNVAGTYFIKPNQPSLGAHVCNCGYMVSTRARRIGLATAMCEHSQLEALRLGFKAMQYNLVVSTNEGAVRLWKDMGFSVVGTLPKSFKHSELGLVDAFVMYKWLET